MRRVHALLLLTLAFLAPTLPAHALSRGSPPYKQGIQWGQSAGSSYIRAIPQGSQIGIQNCAASYTDGFPPLTFLPAAAGGCPPFGQDMNGILNALSLGLQWAFAGGTMSYDATFQTQIGGYPRDALIQSNILHGRVWQSTVDNNLTNPDDQTGAAISWSVPPGAIYPGSLIPSMLNAGYPNAVLANGNTVGNTGSNATNRANPDTYWLFTQIWNLCFSCGIFNSAGGSTTKGATAAADWAANKAVATPDMRGTGVVGVDASTSRLASAPVISGSINGGGSLVGETNNTHILSTAEIPSHFHSTSTADPAHYHTAGMGDPTHTHTEQYPAYSFYAQCSSCGPVYNAATTNTGAAGTGVYINSSNGANNTYSAGTGVYMNSPNGGNTTYSAGGGGAHNIVPRDLTVYWWLAL